MSLFGNRSINLKMVNDKKQNAGESNPFEGVEVATAYSEIAKDFITHTAIVVTSAYVVCKIFGKICK